MSDLYQFHVNLFAAQASESFDLTWEEAAASLQKLPRMLFELDGSFVCADVDRHAHRWQIDGHLFDFADRLHRVELRGACPPANFDELLRCFGWPAQRLMFEMVREGVTVDEPEFRLRAVEYGDAPP